MQKTKTSLILTALIMSLGIQAQMEKLTRGTVAMHRSKGNYITWRLLGTDPKDISFELQRDGKTIASNMTLTSYTDNDGTEDSKYRVIVKDRLGNITDISAEAQTWPTTQKQMKLDRPHGGSISYKAGLLGRNQPTYDSTGYYNYYAQEACVGDADGDGDGCSELICKTGPGTKDGLGHYVSEAADDETIRNTDNTADYRNAAGHVMSGPEFLTVFDGKTGRAVHTIWYNPNRGFSTGRTAGYGNWGDDYGNRGERFLACVAYLDGKDSNPSAVMCRGYYTRSYLWAVDFDGEKLKQKWLHASVSKTRIEVTDADGRKTVTSHNSNTTGKGDCYTAYGQGCHSIAVGDVDGDGCDEIIYGSAAINNDGTLLYSTGLGHGDAHHLSDLMPDRPGLEFMMPHEDAGNGWHVRDAATGEMLIWKPSSGDNGRGMAADIDATHRGAEFWSAADRNVYDTNGNIVSKDKRPAYCFRIYWDGTLYDNLLDGTNITAYNNGNNTRIFQANGCIQNGSKAYPVLSADLFGDWREELILCDATDSCTLHIFSSPNETQFAVPTLMHDHLYRMSVCWQNVAYNQPPHLSYYLPDLFSSRFSVVGEGAKEQAIKLGESIVPITCRLENCTSAVVTASYLNGQKIKIFGVPDGFRFTLDREAGQFTLTATPSETGTYEITIRSGGDATGVNIEDTVRVTVAGTDGIHDMHAKSEISDRSAAYNLLGQKVGMTRLNTGLYIIGRKKIMIKQ